jgi:hypothetical protein
MVAIEKYDSLLGMQISLSCVGCEDSVKKMLSKDMKVGCARSTMSQGCWAYPNKYISDVSFQAL